MTFSQMAKKALRYSIGAFARFRGDIEHFSLSIAFWNLLAFLFTHSGLLRTATLCVAIHNKKHEVILSYLRSKFSAVLDLYVRQPETYVRSHCSRIWVCWFQGEKNAPEIVKRCIESIRANSGGREVVIITQDNYTDYVSFPPCIIDKYNRGVITRTHFSDLLRIALLATHGGLWLDATVFCSKRIPDSYFDSTIFSCRISNETTFALYVSKGKWTSFIIGGQPGSLLFRYMMDALFAYNERYDVLIDYFVIDYFIALGRAEIPAIRAHLDALPQNNPDCHGLAKLMNRPFNRGQLEKLLSGETVFYKLSYKTGYTTITPDGRLTFYGALIKGENWEV